MPVLGTTGDKVLSAGASAGATAGATYGGAAGAVAGAVIGAALSIGKASTAQKYADNAAFLESSAKAVGPVMGVKYITPPSNIPPPSKGSLGYAINLAASDPSSGSSISTITSSDYTTGNDGTIYFRGIPVPPFVGFSIMPDGSYLSGKDFNSVIAVNLGRALNAYGYGINKGPTITFKDVNTTMTPTVQYVQTTPNGSKLTADALTVLGTMGISINSTSPASLLSNASSTSSKNPILGGLDTLSADASSLGISLNPVTIGLIILLIIFIIYKYS